MTAAEKTTSKKLTFIKVKFHISLTRHFVCEHSIFRPMHDLERTVNKPFTGLPGLRRVYNSSSLPSKLGSIFDRAFKNNIIYLDSVCSSFTASEKWRTNIWYRKRNITSFIFLSKNVETFVNSLYHKSVCPGLYVSESYLYLIKIVIFERNTL